ncbi:F-box plant-like protein, putative [Arachis hypogaea]|nr:F-box plant-like protein, putative [Arachis hypogaea]
MLQWSMVPFMAGSLDAAINTFEHEGQVESDMEKRENGELLEMKVAMKLERSVSQLLLPIEWKESRLMNFASKL